VPRAEGGATGGAARGPRPAVVDPGEDIPGDFDCLRLIGLSPEMLRDLGVRLRAGGGEELVAHRWLHDPPSSPEGQLHFASLFVPDPALWSDSLFIFAGSISAMCGTGLALAATQLATVASVASGKTRAEVRTTADSDTSVQQVVANSLTVVTGNPGAGKTTAVSWMSRTLASVSRKCAATRRTARAAQGGPTTPTPSPPSGRGSSSGNHAAAEPRIVMTLGTSEGMMAMFGQGNAQNVLIVLDDKPVTDVIIGGVAKANPRGEMHVTRPPGRFPGGSPSDGRVAPPSPRPQTST